jgi:hypothetical protein
VRRKKNAKRIIYFLSFFLVYTQTHTHIHNFVLIQFFFYSVASIHERKKEKIHIFRINMYMCIKKNIVFCHSESGSMYLWVKRNEKKERLLFSFYTQKDMNKKEMWTHTHTHSYVCKRELNYSFALNIKEIDEEEERWSWCLVLM